MASFCYLSVNYVLDLGTHGPRPVLCGEINESVERTYQMSITKVNPTKYIGFQEKKTHAPSQRAAVT